MPVTLSTHVRKRVLRRCRSSVAIPSSAWARRISVRKVRPNSADVVCDATSTKNAPASRKALSSGVVQSGHAFGEDVDMFDIDRAGAEGEVELRHQLDRVASSERLECLVQRNPGGVSNDLLGKDPRGLVSELVEASRHRERARLYPRT